MLQENSIFSFLILMLTYTNGSFPTYSSSVFLTKPKFVKLINCTINFKSIWIYCNTLIIPVICDLSISDKMPVALPGKLTVY